MQEQHYTAGGYTHSYERNGYEWDVGVHYIGDIGLLGAGVEDGDDLVLAEDAAVVDRRPLTAGGAASRNRSWNSARSASASRASPSRSWLWPLT